MMTHDPASRANDLSSGEHLAPVGAQAPVGSGRPSSGRPVVFGDTNAGRRLMVVYELVDDETIYPVTAYDVSRRQGL
jgi:hypothetical protein